MTEMHKDTSEIEEKKCMPMIVTQRVILIPRREQNFLTKGSTMPRAGKSSTASIQQNKTTSLVHAT